MDILDQFHAYILLYKQVSLNTYLAYKKDAEDFLYYLSCSNLSINEAKAANYIGFLKSLEKKKVSRSTAIRKVSALKMLARYLHDKCELPDISNEIKIDSTLPILAPQEKIENILKRLRSKKHNHADSRSYVMLYLLYVSHIEVNQLVLLQQQDIDHSAGLIRVKNPGNKSKFVTLPLDFHQVLQIYIAQIPFETPFLFPVKLGSAIRPISKQAVWSLLKSLLNDEQSITALTQKKPFSGPPHELMDEYKKLHPRK